MAKKKSSKSTLKDKTTLSSMQLVVFAIAFALLGGLISWAAFAAPHRGGGSGGTISLVMVTDNNSDGQPNYKDKVTFAVSTSSTTQPWVTVQCSQNGTLVYQQSNGIFPTSLNQTFTLGPTPNWQGGAANCTAKLQNWDSYSKNGKIVNLASMSFTANP